jgi:hypothetical protein
MKNESNSIYQLKLIQKGNLWPAWRIIQIPDNYTFLDLHNFILESTGCKSKHSHEFKLFDRVTNRVIIVRNKDGESIDIDDVISDKETQLYWWLSESNKYKYCRYNFAVQWEHEVVFEKVLIKAKNVKYPVTIESRRAFPLEGTDINLKNDQMRSAFGKMISSVGRHLKFEYIFHIFVSVVAIMEIIMLWNYLHHNKVPAGELTVIPMDYSNPVIKGMQKPYDETIENYYHVSQNKSDSVSSSNELNKANSMTISK